MYGEFIDLFEQTPKLESKKCRFFAFILWIFLQFSIYIIALYSIFYYGYIEAFFITIFSFIVIGIIRSKLRNSSIPITQREFAYNDRAIATWYTAKELCFGTN